MNLLSFMAPVALAVLLPLAAYKGAPSFPFPSTNPTTCCRVTPVTAALPDAAECPCIDASCQAL